MDVCMVLGVRPLILELFLQAPKKKPFLFIFLFLFDYFVSYPPHKRHRLTSTTNHSKINNDSYFIFRNELWFDTNKTISYLLGCINTLKFKTIKMPFVIWLINFFSSKNIVLFFYHVVSTSNRSQKFEGVLHPNMDVVGKFPAQIYRPLFLLCDVKMKAQRVVSKPFIFEVKQVELRIIYFSLYIFETSYSIPLISDCQGIELMLFQTFLLYSPLSVQLRRRQGGRVAGVCQGMTSLKPCLSDIKTPPESTVPFPLCNQNVAQCTKLMKAEKCSIHFKKNLLNCLQLKCRTSKEVSTAQWLCQNIYICKHVEFGLQIGWSMLNFSCRQLSKLFLQGSMNGNSSLFILFKKINGLTKIISLQKEIAMQKVPGSFFSLIHSHCAGCTVTVPKHLHMQTCMEFGWQLGWKILNFNCRKLSKFLLQFMPSSSYLRGLLYYQRRPSLALKSSSQSPIVSILVNILLLILDLPLFLISACQLCFLYIIALHKKSCRSQAPKIHAIHEITITSNHLHEFWQPMLLKLRLDSSDTGAQGGEKKVVVSFLERLSGKRVSRTNSVIACIYAT
ncbi:hypothetical protein VP01_4138g1 [Puccinia sorghi]|uniref:Uncharacterized protein n=1 Tax=Puccinia sorghi TaxID=27349 RepID=A0A0L6UT17_9BASI|nr:hypothetical protein VP01_4138g1 [Puccinia sorghi]